MPTAEIAISWRTLLRCNDVLGTFGTASRRFFHGPGIINTDFGLSKNTRITESMAFDLRAEFFNILTIRNSTTRAAIISSSRFGLVSDTRAARIGQFSAKFYW